MKVYLVQHVHLFDKNQEDVKIIGIYSSPKKAIKAIDKLSEKPGFKEHSKIIDPNIYGETSGFIIHEYKIDKNNWKEGFISDYQ